MTHLHTPDDTRIFVFGSNLLGIHGAGAALYARASLGFPPGVWGGHVGRAYAIPTCYRPGYPMPVAAIQIYVKQFTAYAERNPELRFFVSAIGCGLAGHSEAEIKPLFAGAPLNCDLPPGWR